MAIQAQMHSNNIGLPLGVGGGGSREWLMMDSHNNNSSSNNPTTNNFFFNGCGLNDFGFNLQHKHQEQHQQQLQITSQQQQQYLVQFHDLHQRNQNQYHPCENGFVFLPPSKTCNNNNGCTTSTMNTTGSSDHLSMNLSHDLGAQFDKHRQEMDRYITLQTERLRVALQEQRKQQEAILMRKVEAKARVLLRQKDEELTKEKNRGMELEECARMMEVENQAWQRVAAEREAMVASLNNTLEQLREQQQQQGCCLVDDAESCCDDNDYPNKKKKRAEGHDDGREDDEETGSGTTGRRETEMMTMMRMVCRFCNGRNACMLLLPCRHLCSCKSCEPFIGACPLCKSPKTTSIEALFS